MFLGSCREARISVSIYSLFCILFAYACDYLTKKRKKKEKEERCKIEKGGKSGRGRGGAERESYRTCIECAY